MIQTNKSATLSTNNDQYLFVPVYSVENHPTDSRVKIDPNGTVQTLTSRMGTGGGNVPLILTYDARGNGDGKTVNTITGDHNNRVTDYTCVVCEPVVYNGENITSPTNKANPKEGDPCHTLGTDSRNYLVYCLQGNGIERSDTAGCCGKGWTEDKSYTLNTMDRHAVAYSQQAYDEYVETDKGSTLKSSGGNYGGRSENIVVEPQYIVRRLCPTECARLQGFPTIVEVDMKDITRDEVCAIALATGHIRVNVESGKVYATRGPGGVERTSPIELKGSIVNGYKVHSLHAAGFKKQVRANRLVWIAAHGAIPEGMIVDHINNDKTDNRLANLQLLTPKANSTKAKEDGRYLTGDDHRGTKINDCGKKALCFLYWNTDKPYSYFAKMFGISDSRAQQIIHENHWGHPDKKDDFTDEEYAFWLKVRNDWATINGKKVKEYTKEQMLKWYNSLHTDSAEYEMWGNGIALPNALYVMEGIAEVLRRRKWTD